MLFHSKKVPKFLDRSVYTYLIHLLTWNVHLHRYNSYYRENSFRHLWCIFVTTRLSLSKRFNYRSTKRVSFPSFFVDARSSSAVLEKVNRLAFLMTPFTCVQSSLVNVRWRLVSCSRTRVTSVRETTIIFYLNLLSIKTA